MKLLKTLRLNVYILINFKKYVNKKHDLMFSMRVILTIQYNSLFYKIDNAIKLSSTIKQLHRHEFKFKIKKLVTAGIIVSK